MPTLQDVQNWSGQDAVDPSGDKVGSLDHIYLDRQTGEPTFLAVKTGLFGHNLSLVPVEGARTHEGHVHLAFDKVKVTDAPNIEADGELSEAEEARLYEYYAIGGYASYDGPDHDTLAGYDRPREPVGRDTSGPATDEAMTRSEEQLRVGTRSEEVGRARLRKYIVTENVTTTVPVQREEVRIEREPITDANRGDATSGAAITDEEHEVVLHSEEAVVDKQTVPKERIRMDKQTTVEDQQVSETVRKEEVDVDDDGRDTR